MKAITADGPGRSAAHAAAILSLLAWATPAAAQEIARVDSSTGRLTHEQRPPLRVLYILDRSGPPFSLVLEISGERFQTFGQELSVDTVEFRWHPGDAPVSCTLVWEGNAYDGDCLSESGESFHLTMEAPHSGGLPPPDTVRTVEDSMGAVPDTLEAAPDTLAPVPDTTEAPPDTLADPGRTKR